MNKYVDAEKLKTEIKRQQRSLTLLANTEQVSVRRDCALQNGVYVYILDIINSLQQELPEVDLEKEINTEISKWTCYEEIGFGAKYDAKPFDGRDIEKIARHFAEWGAIHLNAKKEEEL